MSRVTTLACCQDPLQAPGRQSGDPLAPGQRLLAPGAHEGEAPGHADSDNTNTLLQVASLWLALDEVTETNGAMEMFKFSDAPQTRHTNLNVTRCVTRHVSRVTCHV